MKCECKAKYHFRNNNHLNTEQVYSDHNPVTCIITAPVLNKFLGFMHFNSISVQKIENNKFVLLKKWHSIALNASSSFIFKMVLNI